MPPKEENKDLVTINIDMKQFGKWADNAHQFVLNPDFEESLAKLIEMGDIIEEVQKMVKAKIAEILNAENPDIAGKNIIGDKIKVSFRAYGSAYKVDLEHLAELPEQLYDKKVTYSVNTKELEKYIKLNGIDALPLGISAVSDRAKSVSFSRKDKNDLQIVG